MSSRRLAGAILLTTLVGMASALGAPLVVAQGPQVGIQAPIDGWTAVASRPVPYVAQGRAPWCAAAATAMVLGAHGPAPTAQEVARAVTVHRDGIAWIDLAEHLPSRGYTAWIGRANAAELRALLAAGLPTIAITRDPEPHAVVVTGHQGPPDGAAGEWRLRDPAAPGVTALSAAEFARQWSGGLVIIRPLDAPAPAGVNVAEWTRRTAAHRARAWHRRAIVRASTAGDEPATDRARDALALLDRALAEAPADDGIRQTIWLDRAAVSSALGLYAEACATVWRARAAPAPVGDDGAAIIARARALGCRVTD